MPTRPTGHVCLPAPGARAIVAVTIVTVIVVLIVLGYAPGTAIAIAVAACIAAAEVTHRVLIWPAQIGQS